MSPRPTNVDRETAAARRRSSSSTSTYFGDATLPSSTTSHSGPISRQQRPRARLERPAVARVFCIDVAARKRAHGRVRDERVRAAQPGVRRDDVDAAADDRVAGLGRRGEPPRVGQLAAEVQAADEGEHVAERRAVGASAARPRARTGAFGDSTCFARVPLQFAGDKEEDRGASLEQSDGDHGLRRSSTARRAARAQRQHAAPARPETNSQSPADGGRSRSRVPLEQREVLRVRFPEHVGDVADERHRRRRGDRSRRSPASAAARRAARRMLVRLHDDRRRDISAVSDDRPPTGMSPMSGSQPNRRLVPGTRKASSSSPERAQRSSSSRSTSG